jgi:hypothetical protein
LDFKDGLLIAGFAIGVATNVATVVAIFTTVRNKLAFLTETFAAFVVDNKSQIVRLDGLHERHFSHQANTGIHQESMSKDTLALHFSSIEANIRTLGEQFASHSREDMEVFRSVNENLNKIRERLPSKNGAPA